MSLACRPFILECSWSNPQGKEGPEAGLGQGTSQAAREWSSAARMAPQKYLELGRATLTRASHWRWVHPETGSDFSQGSSAAAASLRAGSGRLSGSSWGNSPSVK